ncbi:MAG: hypothetical protein HZR80_10875 [Candidatus Heimdallarchaeota archaeon]
MTLQNRSFNWDKDFELVRDFLGKTYPLKDSHFTRVPSRFENRKAGSCGTEYQDEEDKEVTIWEEIDKIASQPKIIAVLAIEKQKVCWLQIHPKYRFYEEEIIHWIEEQRKKTRVNFSVDCPTSKSIQNDSIRFIKSIHIILFCHQR